MLDIYIYIEEDTGTSCQGTQPMDFIGTNTDIIKYRIPFQRGRIELWSTSATIKQNRIMGRVQSSVKRVKHSQAIVKPKLGRGKASYRFTYHINHISHKPNKTYYYHIIGLNISQNHEHMITSHKTLNLSCSAGTDLGHLSAVTEVRGTRCPHGAPQLCLSVYEAQ